MFAMKLPKKPRFQSGRLTTEERLIAYKRLEKTKRLLRWQYCDYVDALGRAGVLDNRAELNLEELNMGLDMERFFFGSNLRLQGEARAFLKTREDLERTEYLISKIWIDESLNEQDLADLNRLTGKPKLKIDWFRLFL